MRSSHKQDKYLLEQAYVNLREKINPYDVLDKIRESEDGTLNDILGGALNTFDISYDSEELIQYIADEMDEAGYTSEVIKDITGVDLQEIGDFENDEAEGAIMGNYHPDEDEDLLPSQQLGPINSY